MFDELHPKNQQRLREFATKPHHALVVTMNHPLELESLITIFSNLLMTKSVVRVNEDEAISIESVRDIQRLAKLRKDVSEQHIFTLNVERGISIEAQNSLLKTLEEPPANTLLILFTIDRSKLLPTIYSRAHEITISPIDYVEFERRTKASASEARALAAAYNQTFAIKHLESTRPFEDVKSFLSSDHGSRLKMIQSFKQRESALEFTQKLTVLAAHTLNSIAKTNKREASGVWVEITEKALDTNQAITNNGNVALHLQRLALSVPHLK